MAILHPTKTLTALLPRYVTRFACIGDRCEDNCCSGWLVTLDKKTYRAYRESKHPVLGKLFEKHVKRHRAGADDEQYGKIELDPGTKQCPMMDDGLCSVQKQHNASYLSTTCFNYPRQTRRFAGQVEQALVLSCPEAARQALLHEDAFEFEQASVMLRADSIAPTTLVPGLGAELMSEVRIFCLQLMRTRELALWERLAILGVFCESLGKAMAEGHQARVPSLLQEFATLVEQGSMIEALRELQPNYEAQARVFAAIFAEKGFISSSSVQSRMLLTVARNLGADDSGYTSPQALVSSYRRGLQRLDEALAGAPYLLENYLLNEMFMMLFPFDGTSPFDCYLQLVSRFGLLRLILAARCNVDGEVPGTDVLVDTVHDYCRRFQHDKLFSRRVNSSLHDSGWASLDRLYGFLRT